MTEAHGANDAISDDDVIELMSKAEKGDQEALPALRKWLDANPGYWDYVADLARTTQDALVMNICGEKKRCCARNVCAQVQGHTPGACRAIPIPNGVIAG